jgi:hypothetical protein
LWTDLRDQVCRHILVEGGTSAERAEMLRVLALGLAMTTRPALVQLLAIDLTGRELSILETLPHAVTEAANDAAAAQVSLIWLATELRARMVEGRRWPEMVLLVEDVARLAESPAGRGRAALTSILRSGGAWGIHVLAAAPLLDGGLKAAGWSRSDAARITVDDRPDTAHYADRGRRVTFHPLRLTAAELDRIARGWRPSARSGAAGFGASGRAEGGNR